MPVKLSSRLPGDAHDEARIEIVPLIDIMFFLLASFMLVSLSMVNLKSVKVNLPTAATAAGDTTGKDFADISVDKTGLAFLDQKPVDDVSLVTRLKNDKQANANLRVFISGDRDARHGDIIRVLDLVRQAGIDKVAFEISSAGPANIRAAGGGAGGATQHP